MLNTALKLITPYRYLPAIFLVYFLISGAFRLLLATDNQAFSGNTFLYGLRMDLIIISLFSLFSLLLVTLNLRRINRIYISTIFSLFVLLEFINIYFFAEFNLRINYLFVENLAFITQLFPMLRHDYAFSLISAAVIIPLLFYIVYTQCSRFYNPPGSLKQRLILFPVLLLALLILSRTSFDRAPPNASYYSWSNNHTTNEISNNTIFSLLSSIIFHRDADLAVFGKPPVNNKTLFKQAINSSRKQKKRIVLTIMESFGHLYVGSLGGKKSSPEFDKLSQQGLFFSNMYSSSNRTNRGTEAILSSIYPFIGRTYLKLSGARENFWTIASSLKQQGYRTIFLYGGDINFDNMRSFLFSNGYDEILASSTIGIDSKEFAWGYADEDVYNKALDILDTSDKPVFLTILTLSNHEPFDYPKDKTPLTPDVPENSFENSMRYADWALGKFTQDLKTRNLFEDSLLVFVADHNSKSTDPQYGTTEPYRIPALFLANDLDHREIKTVTHQVDIAPTLLAAAGISTTIPAQGFNMLESSVSRALIIKQKSYIFLKDEGQVIYQPNQAPIGERKLFEEGLSLIYDSYAAYENKTHR